MYCNDIHTYVRVTSKSCQGVEGGRVNGLIKSVFSAYMQMLNIYLIWSVSLVLLIYTQTVQHFIRQ